MQGYPHSAAQLQQMQAMAAAQAAVQQRYPGQPVLPSMPGQQPPISQQQQQQQQQIRAAPQMAAPAPTAQAKRTLNTHDASLSLSSAEVLKQHKKRKATDRALPASLLSHDEGLVKLQKEYEKLLELEKTLDSTYTRKKAELLEESTSIRRTTHKSLRVRISNECADQEWQDQGTDIERPDFETGKGIPSWTVKIEGKLRDLEGITPAPESEYEALPKFSQLVQHMAVDIERPEGVHREPALLNWQSTPQNIPSDGFTFTRSGTTPVRLRIALYLIQQPRRFKLAPDLANLLNLKEESKIGILTAMWSYIQRERLLESGAGQPEIDRRNIRCDEKLHRLFGAQKMPFYQMSETINRYLSQPDPVILDYSVDVSPFCTASSKSYDILLELPDPSLRSSQSLLRGLAPNSSSSTEIIKLDETLSSSISSIRALAYQNSLLSRFAQNPVVFMQEWMESQSLDLQDLLDPDATKGMDGDWKSQRLRDSGWFAQDWVKDAVGVHIARQQAAGR